MSAVSSGRTGPQKADGASRPVGSIRAGTGYTEWNRATDIGGSPNTLCDGVGAVIGGSSFGGTRKDGSALLGLYLASDEAAFITGQTLRVNGGLV